MGVSLTNISVCVHWCQNKYIWILNLDDSMNSYSGSMVRSLMTLYDNSVEIFNTIVWYRYRFWSQNTESQVFWPLHKCILISMQSTLCHCHFVYMGACICGSRTMFGWLHTIQLMDMHGSCLKILLAQLIWYRSNCSEKELTNSNCWPTQQITADFLFAHTIGYNHLYCPCFKSKYVLHDVVVLQYRTIVLLLSYRYTTFM